MPLKAGDKVTREQIEADGWVEMQKALGLIYFYKPKGKKSYKLSEPKGKKTFNTYPIMVFNEGEGKILSIINGVHFKDNKIHAVSIS